jgi:hypothetical protein
MSSINSTSAEKLARLVGTPKSPAIIDVRTDEDVAGDPSLIPSAVRRPHDNLSTWASALRNSAVVVCQDRLKLSHGVAAWLRSYNVAASLGLSRMYSNDLAQLEAGMSLYDAFYLWCRDATGEPRNWPINKGQAT